MVLGRKITDSKVVCSIFMAEGTFTPGPLHPSARSPQVLKWPSLGTLAFNPWLLNLGYFKLCGLQLAEFRELKFTQLKAVLTVNLFGSDAMFLLKLVGFMYGVKPRCHVYV